MKWLFSARRRRWTQSMNDELRFHLDSQIAGYMSRGMTREDAEQRARREFGPLDLAREECRDQKPSEPFERLLRELRHAFRALWKSPGITIAAILTLALGIGANTAIFSAIEGVVLKPLPYPQPDRLALVLVYNRALKSATYLSYPDFLDWKQAARSFETIAGFTPQGFDVSSPGLPEHVNGKQVSADFFRVLGVRPALGRGLSPAEDRLGGAPAVVISDRLWRGHFASSRDALGKSLTLDGEDYTVVGVLTPGFLFDEPTADVYTPLGRRAPLESNDRTIHDVACIARLKAGVTLGQAQAEMNAVQQHIDDLNPSTERGLGASVISLKQSVVGDVGSTLLLLLGAVGLVLLIACANVANLLLARSAARTREFAVRLALGASRTQIVRQLLTESLLLSGVGGLLGLAIAQGCLRAILSAVPQSLPRTGNIGVNAPVLLFAFGVSLLVGVLFGLLPAVRSSRTDVSAGLKAGGRGVAGSRHRAQSVLAVVQIAVALVLLAGGSLLLRTLRNLWAVKPGFDPQHVITFQVGLPASATTGATVRSAYRQLIERLRQVPGVDAVEITALVPMGHAYNEGAFWAGTHQPASMAEIPRAIYYPTGPDYLRTMKIPLLRGRFLTASDTINSERRIVIDSLLARTFFPGRDPIGQSLTVPHWGVARIVGIVDHVRQYGLDNSVGEKPQIYYSFFQLPDQWVPAFRSDVRLALRTRLEEATLIPAIENAARGAGSGQPVYDVHTMHELVAGSIGRQRLPTLLLGAFALLAWLLASIGTYGVISYSTVQRFHEIGIRIALGARRGDVLGMVVGQGIRLALIGIALGMAAALVSGRLLSSFSRLLYGVRTNDPLTFIAVPLLLIAAVLIACYVPARRAARLNPLAALRHD